MKNEYQVIVGNIGTVCDCANLKQANKTFTSYVKDSKAQYGRAAGESVTMFCNGNISREYIGTVDWAAQS